LETGFFEQFYPGAGAIMHVWLIFNSWKYEPIELTRLSPLRKRRGTTLHFLAGIVPTRRRDANF
jgi:hypothetical protein